MRLCLTCGGSGAHMRSAKRFLPCLVCDATGTVPPVYPRSIQMHQLKSRKPKRKAA